MAKKRKTRKEKIIIQLKRRLAKSSESAYKATPVNIKPEPRQGAVSLAEKIEPQEKPVFKKPDVSIYFYDPKLIKKDLLKTSFLTLVVLVFETVLYLKLR